MPNEDAWYRWQDEYLVLRVRVQPRAKRDELIGPHSGYLRALITAPPVEGKANHHLRRFLANEFGVPQSRVRLVAGTRTGAKRISIQAPRKLPASIKPR